MMSVWSVVIELAGGGGARPQAEGKNEVLSRVSHGFGLVESKTKLGGGRILLVITFWIIRCVS